MKKIILFAVIALGACLSSCKSPVSMYSTRTARSEVMPIQTWNAWTTADLEVSDIKVRLTVEAPLNDNLMINETQLRENAIGELLEKYNADVLINPLFKTDYRDGRLSSVTVSGYPARHRNFRTISFEEQTKYMVEKEKAVNVPQVVINGGEIVNNVAPAPAPSPAPADKPAPNTNNKKK